MSLINNIVERGYLYQCTNLDRLTEIINTKKICAYVGFDCTADSLHIGNLLPIMFMRLLQKYGHKPIILLGSATTRIGDPSFKKKIRPILTEEQIQNNINGIKKSLSKFIDFTPEKENAAILLSNSTWLDDINYFDFLRNFGIYISINKMLSLDSIKERLNSNNHLSFLEFNYMLLQAYDFYYLNKNYNCILEIGGQDQWGNIIMGVDLVSRINKKEVFGLTIPLLLNSSGEKMGKTIAGAVWLNKDKLSPYSYFQYWRNIDDSSVINCAKLYAEFDTKELDDFKLLIKKDINASKKHLAFRLTSICHGVENANIALKAAEEVFEKRIINENLPTFTLSQERLNAGVHICDLLYSINIVSSKSEAKRLIRGGGLKINDGKLLNENTILDKKNLQDNYIKITIAKKYHIIIKIDS